MKKLSEESLKVAIEILRSIGTDGKTLTRSFMFYEKEILEAIEFLKSLKDGENAENQIFSNCYFAISISL